LVEVLITGATGFIGSHLTRLLVHEGCTVHALIRRSSNPWRINDVLQSVRPIYGDLDTFNECRERVAGIRPEVCFHLAWYAEPGKYMSSEENVNMLAGSLDLARHLASSGCRRLVSVGTCFEYDTDLGYLSESSPTKPRSLYAASKLGLYAVLQHFLSGRGIELAWVRLFYQYGPYEDPRRLVPSVICSLLRGERAKVSKGFQIRDFLHVEDVAAAIWAVGRGSLSGAVNVGSGKPVTVREVATAIGSVLGRQDLIEFGGLAVETSEPIFVCANNRRLTETTGWLPRYDLEKGLQSTINWWKGSGKMEN
jgi:nucleoside-diphosphate-sugar epimerase